MENAAVFAGAMFALAMMLFVTSDWAETPPLYIEGRE